MKSKLYAGETLLGTLTPSGPPAAGFWASYTFDPESAFEAYRATLAGVSRSELDWVQASEDPAAMFAEVAAAADRRWAAAEKLNLRMVTEGWPDSLLTWILIDGNRATVRGAHLRFEAKGNPGSGEVSETGTKTGTRPGERG